MSISGSVQVGGFSSKFEISHGRPDFELRIGGERAERGEKHDAPKTARREERQAADDCGCARDARSEQFLEDVKAVKDPSSKRALIDNFVKDAIAENRDRKAEKKEARAEGAGAEKAEKSGGRKAEPGQGDQLRFKPVMKELQGLAESVDKSKLPEATQNAMLDGIANLAAELSDIQAEGGDLRQAALLGTADLAETLDEARGSDEAKGPIMDQIADALSGIATGDLGGPQEAAAPEGDEACACEDASGSDGASGADEPSASEESSGPWTHSVKDGKAEIQLGDKYTITAQEDGEAWTVKNNETGAVTKISGDPHVDVGNDGQNDWDFKKDMTFQLDDGTKITVGTVPADNGTTYSSSLTITNGDKAMQVTGLAGDADGKDNLKVVQSDEGGEAIDDFTLDGFTIDEEGPNWVDAGGATINQDIVNNAEKVA
jgi:hypothetical protein